MQNHLKKLKEKFDEMKEDTINMEKSKKKKLIKYIAILVTSCLHLHLLIDPELFKNHQLPLARVKKIMKSDEDVRVYFFIL